jgi:hypothetical protein
LPKGVQEDAEKSWRLRGSFPQRLKPRLFGIYVRPEGRTLQKHWVFSQVKENEMEDVKLTIELYSDRPRVCRSAPDLRSRTRCLAEIIFHNENDEEEYLCKEHVAQRLRGNPDLLAAVNELLAPLRA